MSGHSKWHNIKNQKGAADQRRGLEFTKLSNLITIAVKTSGGNADPDSNFKLRLAVEKAKTVNMPKENIQRAIERAKGLEAGQLEEIIYEGFGPGGIAVLVETATDNRQRTVQEMKNAFETSGGTLGSAGATAHLFTKMGLLAIGKAGKITEEIMDKAIVAGVEDLEEAGEEILIYTKPESLHEVHEKLKEAGLVVEDAELIFKPNLTIPMTSVEAAKRVINFIEKLEENESVQHVFANFEIEDKILQEL